MASLFTEGIKSRPSAESETGHCCGAEREKSECLERGGGAGEGQVTEPAGVGLGEGFGELN